MSDLRFLSVEEILTLHDVQISRFGGSAGLRDAGMLESAVAMPEAGFGDAYLHEDIFEMAAAYLFHIVMNHPFVDGNKRTVPTPLSCSWRTTDLRSPGIRMLLTTW